MPSNYILIPQAKLDMNKIVRYISRDNTVAARKLRESIIDACEIIGKNPYIGQERGDLTNKNVRFFVAHHNYMIIYKADTSPVQILRIYNSAQHVDSILH